MPTDEGPRSTAKEKNADASATSGSTSEFQKMRKEELEEIKTRRSRAELKKGEPAPDQNLVGLALSGGGIRSAAFSLGVVHALGLRGVMPFVNSDRLHRSARSRK
jgi:predicted acylesterase/phospholipase RssA